MADNNLIETVDVAVIGGGSAGVPFVKQAKRLQPSLKIVLFDYVKPSLHGSTWAFGGTCLMSGCIKKKLFKCAASLQKSMEDARRLGWTFATEPTFSWSNMMATVSSHVNSASRMVRQDLKQSSVVYKHAYAQFDKTTDPTGHVLMYKDSKTQEVRRVRAERILLATGTRPRLPPDTECPGARAFGMTSDDLFWLPSETGPGKTLIVGASYIALECASFLHEMGFDVTVLIRGNLLRGFDQQCARIVGSLLECRGIRFIHGTAQRLAKSTPTTIDVTIRETDKPKETTEGFNSVVFAIGREGTMSDMFLTAVGIQMDGDRIKVNDRFETSLPHVLALGDCAANVPELTPVAVAFAESVANQLFSTTPTLADIDKLNVPTTVFTTPYEHSTCGLTEEAAIQAFGVEQITVYALRFASVETSAIEPRVVRAVRSFLFHTPTRDDQRENETENETVLGRPNFAKLVCRNTAQNLVIGFHYVGEHAGEICQGFAVAMKQGLKKDEVLDHAIGIHPTIAETFIRLSPGTHETRSACGGGRCV